MVEKTFTLKMPSARTVSLFLRNLLVVVVVLLTVMGVILYSKVNNASNVADKAAAAAVHKAELAQYYEGQKVCIALIQMDDASHGAVFYKAKTTPKYESYGEKLAHALHRVVEASGCYSHHAKP
jgi:hypothetical protein